MSHYFNMELYRNAKIPFTRWIVENHYLHEKMVVVDVGCRDGLLQNWDILGEFLELHSFDAAADAIEAMCLRDASKPNRHHYVMALGDEDGTRAFFKKPDRFSSSLYKSSNDDIEISVPIRSLDSLMREGVILRADFIKIDVEGHEPAVLRGARELIKTSPTLGLELETNFNVSPIFPKTHFSAVHEILIEQWFLLMDLNFDRVPQGRFLEEAERRNIAANPDAPFCGSPSTFNVLFCRNFCQEADQAHHYLTEPHAMPSIEGLIKTLIILEMYGCLDRAVDLLCRFKDKFAARFDHERAVHLLIDQDIRK
jgi:FkbM family methyltransferase